MAALLGTPGIIDHLHARADTGVGHHLLDAQAVHRLSLPRRAGEQLLQALPIGGRQRPAHLRGRLARHVGQQPGGVTLQCRAALGTANQLGEWRQECRQVGERLRARFEYGHGTLRGRRIPWQDTTYLTK